MMFLIESVLFGCTAWGICHLLQMSSESVVQCKLWISMCFWISMEFKPIAINSFFVQTRQNKTKIENWHRNRGMLLTDNLNEGWLSIEKLCDKSSDKPIIFCFCFYLLLLIKSKLIEKIWIQAVKSGRYMITFTSTGFNAIDPLLDW